MAKRLLFGRMMVFILCTVIFDFCLLTNLQAQQQIAKIAMPNTNGKSTPPANRPSTTTQKAITANNFIKQYNKGEKNSLDSLTNFLLGSREKDNFLPARNALLKQIVPIMTDSNLRLTNLDTLAIPNDSLKVGDSSKSGTEDSTEGAKNGTLTGTNISKKLQKVSDLNVEKTENADYKISIVDEKENPLSLFVLKQFNESLFLDKLRKSLKSLCDQQPPSQDDSVYIEKLTQSFSDQKLYDRLLEASLEVNDAEVNAGVLKIFKQVPATFTNLPKTIDTSKTKKNTAEQPSKKSSSGTQAVHPHFLVPVLSWDSTPVNPPTATNSRNFKLEPNQKMFTVFKIQIQFQDGFIENIKVLGKMDSLDQELKFENSYPIPFSTKRDYENLYSIRLYERTVFGSKSDSKCYIILGNLLSYSQTLGLYSKDYSPANKVIDTDLTNNITSVNLLKEKTSKILEIKVFSDLKGIDNTAPNGLVQLEFSKKLNFWIKRRSWFNNRVNVGLFNYITPYFTVNKIENNNKRLTAMYMGTQQQDTTRPNTFASMLDLYQFQILSLGVDLTCFTVDIPGIKSTISGNISGFFGRTLIADTLRTKVDSASFKAAPISNNVMQYGVNSFQISPEICWQIFPDTRYGLIASQKFTHYSIFSSKIKQVEDSSSYAQYLNSLNGDRSKIDGYKSKKWLGTSEIYAFFMPSAYNKLFIRYRFNWDINNIKNNFHQIQVGIATYLTHTDKDKSAPPKN